MSRLAIRTTVVVFLIILVFAGFIYREKVSDEVRCRLLLHTSSAYHNETLKIPARSQASLLNFLESYSSKQSLIFAIDIYPPGTVGFAHERYEIGICNRHFLATLSNTFEPDVFLLYIGYFGTHPSDEFKKIAADLLQGLHVRGQPERAPTGTQKTSPN